MIQLVPKWSVITWGTTPSDNIHYTDPGGYVHQSTLKNVYNNFVGLTAEDRFAWAPHLALNQAECANAQVNDTHIMDLSYIHINPWSAGDLHLIYPGKKWVADCEHSRCLLCHVAHCIRLSGLSSDSIVFWSKTRLKCACVMARYFSQHYCLLSIFSLRQHCTYPPQPPTSVMISFCSDIYLTWAHQLSAHLFNS